ncbi:MAG: hypothetical protein CL666_04075 [Balneola sp.]|nr:hypothetical protein [Balneola sp.]|tara:strand:+ start:14818 stop:15954 length:1137 start_codon:yes stop_codon:yes gene_type:complete
MDPDLNLAGTYKHQGILKQENPPITLLTTDDIDSVVELSRLYFPGSKESSFQTLKKRTAQLYFKDGELLPHVKPIVSRSANGDINGFLGIITKSFQYKNRMITMANCHHLMATEDGRKQLMPMRLLQHFLSGPQDISLSDGSADSTMELWKRLGGEFVTGESLYYKIPLRPLSLATIHLLKQYPNRMGESLRFVAASMDSIAERLKIPLFYQKKPFNGIIPLSTELMSVLLEIIEPFYLLFPTYNLTDIDSLFQLLEGETKYGTLHKAALFDPNNQPIGWFIYYAQKKGVCEVIQAVSIPGKETELFNALTWHAFSKGGVELSGRLMPSQLQTPFTRKAFSVPARMWTLIHSSDFELKHTIQTGNAFLTRLEGDLWVL